MSLLDIIQDAAILCNLSPPSTVIGSQDPNALMLLRLANQEGNELARRHDWQNLMIDYTVPTLAAEVQSAVPNDFRSFMPYPQLWNTSLGLPYSGPTDHRTWSTLKARGITSAQPGWWRLKDFTINIYPAPTAGQTLAYTYMSNAWVTTVSPVGVNSVWTNDQDTPQITQRLHVLGIVWRYKKGKGLDYAEDMITYEREVERVCSRDRGVGVIRIQRAYRDDEPPYSWTGTVTP